MTREQFNASVQDKFSSAKPNVLWFTKTLELTAEETGWLIDHQEEFEDLMLQQNEDYFVASVDVADDPNENGMYTVEVFFDAYGNNKE